MSEKMTQITLRGIPREFFQAIRQEASKKGSSVNRILLERLVPEKTEDHAGAELLKFSGTWDEARAKDFNEQLAHQRRIDSELWS